MRHTRLMCFLLGQIPSTMKDLIVDNFDLQGLADNSLEVVVKYGNMTHWRPNQPKTSRDHHCYPPFVVFQCYLGPFPAFGRFKSAIFLNFLPSRTTVSAFFYISYITPGSRAEPALWTPGSQGPVNQ